MLGLNKTALYMNNKNQQLFLNSNIQDDTVILHLFYNPLLYSQV